MASAPAHSSIDLNVFRTRTFGDPTLQNDPLRLYRLHSPEVMSDLLKAIAVKNSAAAIATAHRLKGSSATIAATSLAELLIDFESALHRGDWPTASAAIGAIETAFAACLQEIDRLLPPQADH